MTKRQQSLAPEIEAWNEEGSPLSAPPPHDSIVECVSRIELLRRAKAPINNLTRDTIEKLFILKIYQENHPRTLRLLIKNAAEKSLSPEAQQQVASQLLQMRSIGRERLFDITCTHFGINEAQIDRWNRALEDHRQNDMNGVLSVDSLLREELGLLSRNGEKRVNGNIYTEDEDEIGVYPGVAGPVEGAQDRFGECIALTGSKNFAEGIELLARQRFGNDFVDDIQWKDPKAANGERVARLHSGVPFRKVQDEPHQVDDAIPHHKIVGMEPHKIDEIVIDRMGLDMKTLHALNAMGIHTVGDFTGKTVEWFIVKGLPGAKQCDKCKMILEIREMLTRACKKNPVPDGDIYSEAALAAIQARSDALKAKKKQK